MTLAFSRTQLEQIKTFAYQLPRHLHGQYLHHVAELLPRDFGDADVWRAAHKVLHEVMTVTTLSAKCVRSRSNALFVNLGKGATEHPS
jgi:hypothetical protein